MSQLLYQPPCEIKSIDSIIEHIMDHGEISLQKKGSYNPYFELSFNGEQYSERQLYPIIDSKSIIDFSKINEWFKTLMSKSELKYPLNYATIYIWSGDEFTILTTGVYITDKKGFVIKQRGDYSDISDKDKIYTLVDIKKFIQDLGQEYIFIDNTIEASKTFRSKDEYENFSPTELWDRRHKYYV